MSSRYRSWTTRNQEGFYASSLAGWNSYTYHKAVLFIFKRHNELFWTNKLHLRIENRSTFALFFVVDKLAIEYLLGTTFIDERMVSIQPEEGKATAYNSNWAAIIAQGNNSANAAQTKQSTEKLPDKILCKLGNDIKKGHIKPTIVRVGKKVILKPQPIAPVMITML